MKNYIITFGQIHTHRINGVTFDKDSVAVIQAEDYETARDIAFGLFGGRFHDQIPEERFDRDGTIEYFPRGKFPANFKELEND